MTKAKSKPVFPYIRALFYFMFSKRIIPVIAVLVTLVAVAWQVENWRGRQRWEKVKESVLAEGDSLDWRTYVPEAVSDGENAAAHPVFASTLVPLEQTRGNGGFPFKRDFSRLEPQFFGNLPVELLQSITPLELEFWQDVLRNSPTIAWPDPEPGTPAEDVLMATEEAGAGLAAFSDAFSRPRCHWFPLEDYLKGKDLPVGQVSNAVTFAEKLVPLTFVRALAHLDKGDNHAAVSEVLAVVRFCKSMEADPSLIGVLVSMSLRVQVKPHLPDLLGAPKWNSQDLIQIEENLAGNSVIDLLDRTFCRTRAATVYYANATMQGEPWAYEALKSSGLGKWNVSAVKTMPIGWHYQNLAHSVEWLDDALISRYDRDTRRIVDPGRSGRARWKKRIGPYTFISAVQSPDVANLYRTAAKTQGQWDLCRILCAVERHRREEGEPPDALDELVPQYISELPHDYVTGKLPHYDILPDGKAFLATLDWERTGDPQAFLCRIPVDE